NQPIGEQSEREKVIRAVPRCALPRHRRNKDRRLHRRELRQRRSRIARRTRVERHQHRLLFVRCCVLAEIWARLFVAHEEIRPPTARASVRPLASLRSSFGSENCRSSSAVLTSSTSPKPAAARSWSSSCTSTSGTDAPLVTPTVRTPSNHSCFTSC